MVKIRKDTIKNILKIVKCLEQAEDWLWYRECARRTGLHHKTVARLIANYLHDFVEERELEPFKVKLIRLKPGVTTEGIARYLRVKINFVD